MWQYNLASSRANLAERTLTPRNVGRLVLRWAFTFRFTDAASSQPAIVGRTLYVGGHDGRFYALDATTGATKWVFDTSTVVGSQSQPNQLRDGPAVAGGTVYFGDGQGYLYALDARSGALRWATRLGSFSSANPSRAVITSSPLVWKGRVFVGVSSTEESSAVFPFYACCVFQGSVVALDAASGKIVWRYVTVSKPVPAGLNMAGVPRYAPSGGAVWSSPALDARSGTLIVGTGNAYSGNPPGTDAVIALAAQSGHLRWMRQMTAGDAWNFSCDLPQGTNCPHPGPDFDFGSSANVFTIRVPRQPGTRAHRRHRHRRIAHGRHRHRRIHGRNRRTRTHRRHRHRSTTVTRVVVGIGQKSGAYYLLDAATGRTIWQRWLVRPSTSGELGAEEGVKWGSSYDGRRIYASVSYANPGRLYALDPATGRTIWSTPNPSDGCSTGGGAQYASSGDCKLAMPAAVSSSPGLVFEGSLDGKLRAFSSATGRILWQYDTVRSYETSSGSIGIGGSISGAGAVISHGFVYVNSGYNLLDLPGSGIRGNMLLAFGLHARGAAVLTRRIAVAQGSRAAALRACVAAWNARSNQEAQGLLRLHDRQGRRLAIAADMVAAHSECMMGVKVGMRKAVETIRLGLVAGHFVGVPPGEALLPAGPRKWNLRALPDGSVQLRH